MSGPVNHHLLNELERAERSVLAEASLALSPGRTWQAIVRFVAHVIPVVVTARLFTGQKLRVRLPDLVAMEVSRKGFIEPDITRMMIESIRPGDVVFDVGAQFGYHSLLAALLVGQDGKVVAFEPARRTFSLLQGNIRPFPQIRAEQVAVGAADGHALLHDFGARKSALNSLFAEARVPLEERRTLTSSPYEVATTSIDSYCDRHQLTPRFVKIDAEGSELSILQGMCQLLTSTHPTVTLETGDYQGYGHVSTRETIDYLTQLGYDCYEYSDGLRKHQRRASYGYGNLCFRHVDGLRPMTA